MLDIYPKVDMGRVGVRGEEISKFERMDFQNQVRYCKLHILYRTTNLGSAK